MGSFVKQIVYFENVEGMTPNSLARHLALVTGAQEKQFEVVFLYGSMHCRHPLCAAVAMRNREYRKCIKRNNVKFYGVRLKIVQWQDCKKLPHAQWILFPDGSRTSVKGSQHWSMDLNAVSQKKRRQKLDEQGLFFQWETIQTQGEEGFCYAAFDCGCMIQEKRLSERGDMDAMADLILEKSIMAGVQRLVLLGSSIKKAERAKALAAIYPDHLRFTVGYHPEMGGAWKSEKLSALEALLSSRHCVAIGECGIDADLTTVPIKVQVDLLKTQVSLACKQRKPLLIYENRAQNAVLEVLREVTEGLPPVAVRSTTGDCDLDRYVQHGCYLVMSGWMFDKDPKSSPIFDWLRSAKPWMLDYLLLASGGAPQKKSYPMFLDKVVSTEYGRCEWGVSNKYFTEQATNWYKETKTGLQRATPLHLPILTEIIAERTQLSPGDVSRRCLENAKRFFQPVERKEGGVKRSEELGEKRTWSVATVLLIIVALLAEVFIMWHLGDWLLPWPRAVSAPNSV